MPFKGSRGPIIIGVIVIALIIGIIAIAGSMNTSSVNRNRNTTGVVSVYLSNAIGIDQISVMNENTQEPFVFTRTMLPVWFNCSLGDTLTFRITLTKGYAWNGFWFSPQDIWCHGLSDSGEVQISASSNNPFGDILKNNEILMFPYCYRTAPAPTPSPSVIE